VESVTVADTEFSVLHMACPETFVLLVFVFYCVVVQHLVASLMLIADTFGVQHASAASGCTAGENAGRQCARVSFAASFFCVA